MKWAGKGSGPTGVSSWKQAMRKAPGCQDQRSPGCWKKWGSWGLRWACIISTVRRQGLTALEITGLLFLMWFFHFGRPCFSLYVLTLPFRLWSNFFSVISCTSSESFIGPVNSCHLYCAKIFCKAATDPVNWVLWIKTPPPAFCPGAFVRDWRGGIQKPG